MNHPYINLNRLEFLVTYHCSARCQHCSVAPQTHRNSPRCVDASAVVRYVEELSKLFDLSSVMTFGGEPLLFPGVTAAIHAAARDQGIAKRQLITNGFFSRDEAAIRRAADALAASGVNQVLISVDAFHQKTVPLEPVRIFARAMLEHSMERLRFHPAWVINAAHDNPYNRETRRILASLEALGIEISAGNDIFPAGNAQQTLREYYPLPDQVDMSPRCGAAPYTDPLDGVHSLSLTPDGDVYACAFPIGNIHREGIADIVNRYDPTGHTAMAALMDGGVPALVDYAGSRGVSVDIGGAYTACDICRRLVKALYPQQHQ